MQTIVVATDFSDRAFHAAQYAFALARQLQARILLLHAFSWPEANAEIPISAQVLDSLTQQYVAELRALGQPLQQEYAVPVEYRAGLGFLVDELEKTMANRSAQLAVMGMRGANLLEQKVFGTTTSSVLRKAHYPLLAVPANAVLKPIERILFACDYRTLAADNTLTLLKQIALAYQARIQVLHVGQSQPVLAHETLVEEGAHIDRILHGVKHQFAWVEEKSVSAGLERQIAAYQADLLVMIPRELTLWDSLMNQSRTRHMLFKTNIPLLTLPNPVYQG